MSSRSQLGLYFGPHIRVPCFELAVLKPPCDEEFDVSIPLSALGINDLQMASGKIVKCVQDIHLTAARYENMELI